MAENNVFSLEDEDCGNIFITQESNSDSKLMVQDEESDLEFDSVFGISASDFQSPCVSMVKPSENIYSDISDADDFEQLTDKTIRK